MYVPWVVRQTRPQAYVPSRVRLTSGTDTSNPLTATILAAVLSGGSDRNELPQPPSATLQAAAIDIAVIGVALELITSQGFVL